MTERSQGASQLSLSCGPTDPSEYESFEAKARFAVAKYYGMGPEGRWKVQEIADALDVTPRQVYNYLNESQIGRETRKAHAVSDAEWRLGAALYLREEIERLEELEEELLQRSTTVTTDFEDKTVEGVPTADGTIMVSDETDYPLSVPVPSEHEEVTDYGRDIEQIQREKRQYIDQICRLLGLYENSDLRHEQVVSEGSGSVVEYRGVGDASEEEQAE